MHNWISNKFTTSRLQHLHQHGTNCLANYEVQGTLITKWKEGKKPGQIIIWSADADKCSGSEDRVDQSSATYQHHLWRKQKEFLAFPEELIPTLSNINWHDFVKQLIPITQVCTLRLRRWLNITHNIDALTMDLLEQKTICQIQGVNWRRKAYRLIS